jgi:formimidoylglutamate deiminase
LSEAQARFETRSLDEFWSQVDALAPRLDARTQTLGVAAHSIRGVPLEEIEPLYREARSRSMPFHMHVEEQRREIEECGAAYGATPMHLINERLDRADGFTAVHATHTEPAELQRFLEKGGGVCITPLTEANLGDGIPAVIPTRLSLGSDSNARISMLEEMRWLEYAQRLKSETRGVYRDTKGRNAPRLFEVATAGGARALDVASGTITPGALADFFVIDLQSQSIAEVRKENLLAALVFGSGDETIVATCVGGVWTER